MNSLHFTLSGALEAIKVTLPEGTVACCPLAVPDMDIQTYPSIDDYPFPVTIISCRCVYAGEEYADLQYPEGMTFASLREAVQGVNQELNDMGAFVRT